MKKITIENKDYEVPEWVEWVAKDADGEWNGFDKKPLCKWIYGFWKEQGMEEGFTIFYGPPIGDDPEEIEKFLMKV